MFDPDSFMYQSCMYPCTHVSYQPCILGNDNWNHDPGTLEPITSTPVLIASLPVSIVTALTPVPSSSAQSLSTIKPHEVKVCSLEFKFIIATFPGQVYWVLSGQLIL